MKTWLRHILNRLTGSYWFVPGGLVLVYMLFAYASLELDRKEIGRDFWIVLDRASVSANGVRSILSATATSILSLTGLTFSATLVALTLASNQFGSRIIRNFIRSRPNQYTLGILMGNFVLCLVVLRSVRSVDEGEFVPHFASLLAFLATLFSLATFIHFIHHITTSIQAGQIVSRIHMELNSTLDRYFPDKAPRDDHERDAKKYKETWNDTKDEHLVTSKKEGYIQATDIDGLIDISKQLNIVCRVINHPGRFVHKGEAILAIKSDQEIDDNMENKFRNYIIVGRMRTAEQDFEFCLCQLVEVALRALSPSINDPYTALNCIDYLSAALSKIATRRLPKILHEDSDSKTRVIIKPTAFSDLLDAAFLQIRQEAGCRPDVAICLLRNLDVIRNMTDLESYQKAIDAHASAVIEEGSESMLKADRLEVEKSYSH